KNIYKKNIRIVGSTLRSRTPEMKAEILASLVKDIWPKVEAGFIKPTIHAVLPITEAEDAHDILYKGQNVGKVVLKVQ
ncbi:MAG: zinc-binding dehydrogenase, partial [Oscillospiraceae bacterium]|nr:zinc-binding dehydrogenase [Oscillospiraceae bacterium]